MVAYAIMFFPLALVAVRASVAQAPVGLEEVGRSLGRAGSRCSWRVTLPPPRPGPGRRLLPRLLGGGDRAHRHPCPASRRGAETLATQFWAFTSTVSYRQAAPYAAVMVAVAAVPSYVLGRWFDRMPARATVTP